MRFCWNLANVVKTMRKTTNRRKFLKTVTAGTAALSLLLTRVDRLKGKTIEIRCGRGKRLVTLLPIDLKPIYVRPDDPNCPKKHFPNAYMDLIQEIVVWDEETIFSLTDHLRRNPDIPYSEVIETWQAISGIPDHMVFG